MGCVIAAADDSANLARGKNAHVAIVAITRELVGFIWAIGRLGMTMARSHSDLPSGSPNV
jgi:hypothetical protein